MNARSPFLHPSEIGAGQIMYVCATAEEFAATAPFGVAWSGSSLGTFGGVLRRTRKLIIACRKRSRVSGIAYQFHRV